jgi:hypothetical protein
MRLPQCRDSDTVRYFDTIFGRRFVDARIVFPILTQISFISVSCMPAGVRQLAGIVLAILFFQEGNEKNEIYPLTIVGRASNVGNCVGSGSGSRSRAGARIDRGRVLRERSKSKDKSLLEYQLSLAG